MDILWTPWRYNYVSKADCAQRQGVPPELEAWPGDTDCVFCNLLGATGYAVENGMAPVDADRAGKIVYRGERCFVCLNAFPYNPGHVMVLPYRHINELAALETEAAFEMMTLAQRMERTLNRVYCPKGINLGMNLGKAAGAGVLGHLHLHMLPRWMGDTNFMAVIGETRVLPETLDDTWKRLHAVFQEA